MKLTTLTLVALSAFALASCGSEEKKTESTCAPEVTGETTTLTMPVYN